MVNITSLDESELIAAIAKHGPVSIAFQAVINFYASRQLTGVPTWCTYVVYLRRVPTVVVTRVPRLCTSVVYLRRVPTSCIYVVYLCR